MGNFIYVFKDKERDRLLSLGYKLLQPKENTNVYVFENRDDLDLKFSAQNVEGVVSDTLTF